MNLIRALVIVLLLFNGTGALFGGWSLINDPTGVDIKLPEGLLAHSPFTNYLIPGIVLFIVNGIFSFITILWTLLQWRNYYWLVILQGILLCGWITVQVIVIKEFSYLQFIFGGMGITLLLLGLLIKKKSI